MPAFAFRLDPVLEYRQRLEDEQRLLLATALSALRSAEGLRDDCVRRRAELRDRILNHHTAMGDGDLRATYAHCDYLNRSIVDLQRTVEEARAEADRERATLAVKTREKKMLALLKERRRESFAAEAAAAEQRESDELNARRFGAVRA